MVLPPLDDFEALRVRHILVIDQPVRMVSVDTREKAGFAGKAAIAQPKLERCRQRLDDGTYAALPHPLRLVDHGGATWG